MAKQPYIPLYTGDYLKDTRTLTLAAKGAWMDLLIFMWGAEKRGILTGRNSDFARMVGATPEEFASVLLELCLKRICDKSDLGGGIIQLTCRRMIRDAEISAVKAVSGSIGGSKTQANKKAKFKQNHDNDIDNGIAIESVKGKEVKEENHSDLITELEHSFDEIYLEALKLSNAYPGINIDAELLRFKAKVKGSPRVYAEHGTDGLRLAFNAQLRCATPQKQSEVFKL